MKIVVASPVDRAALEELGAHHEVIDAVGATPAVLSARCAEAEVLIFRSGVSISAALMDAAPRLQLLIRAGSGLDNIDLDYLRQRSLPLVRIAEPGARAVAELAFGLMLALSRQILEADRLLRGGHWAKDRLTGALLRGKALGIVGVGNIGTVAAEMGIAWGMRVIGCVEHPSTARQAALATKGIELTDLAAILEQADYVCLFVPLTAATRGLINAAALAQMRDGAMLINLARGAVVDEPALFQALQAPGGVAAAALDVHHQEGAEQISPLAALPQVVLTPHIGAMTVDTQREIGQRIVMIIEHFSSTGTLPPTSVPAASPQHKG